MTLVEQIMFVLIVAVLASGIAILRELRMPKISTGESGDE